MTAPVLGSGSDPICTARVPKPSSVSWSTFLKPFKKPFKGVYPLTGDPKGMVSEIGEDAGGDGSFFVMLRPFIYPVL